MRIELEPDAEGDAPGDLGQLLLVVGNLLENALWHTPRGGLVRLRSRRLDAELVLEIVDEGPGLPDAELGRVFERFYRAPSAHDGGSGLGLATARAVLREIVDLLRRLPDGCQIRTLLRREISRGAAFTVLVFLDRRLEELLQRHVPVQILPVSHGPTISASAPRATAGPPTSCL